MSKRIVTAQVDEKLHDELKRKARKLSARHDEDISVSDIIRAGIKLLLSQNDIMPFLRSEKNEG